MEINQIYILCILIAYSICVYYLVFYSVLEAHYKVFYMCLCTIQAVVVIVAVESLGRF